MRLDLPTRFFLTAVAISAAVVLPFLLGIGGDFIFDDRLTIQYNAALQLTSLDLDSVLTAVYSFHAGHGSRPLAMLSFAIDYWRGGPDPSVFKATNIAIHGLTTIVLSIFLRRFFALAGWSHRRASFGALGVATMWAIHPLQVSSVLYIVQRMQTLGTLFILSALWAYARMRQAQIQNLSSRRFGAAAVLFWGLALASKEDSALLPLYTFLMETTVLRFRAATPQIARRLRIGYLAASVVACSAYLLVVVPNYWHWDSYPGRTFSTYERLLTQGRVLVMYLTQILLPNPTRLPFFYDDLTPSHGLLDPATTIGAIASLAILLAAAWLLRLRRPLFTFGILLFFAGHLITSNVLNLELAFEHRNHFPMVGILIALADLISMAQQRWNIAPRLVGAAFATILLVSGCLTATRAYQWGDPLRFAQTSVELAPRSERAWAGLCTKYFDLNAGVPGSPYIDKAIATCTEGAARTRSPLLLFNVIIYKTFKGTQTHSDWPLFIERLKQAPASAEMVGVYYAILTNIQRDFPMDTQGTLEALKVIADRVPLTAPQYRLIGVYVFNNSPQQEAALPYLERAVRLSPPGSPMIGSMLRDLRAAGREDWAEHLQQGSLRR